MVSARTIVICATAVLWAVMPVHAQSAAPTRTMTTTPAATPAKPPAATPAAPPAARPQAAAASTGAETVRLSADTSKGFARISFLWSKPVTFDASIADGILIVKFARPFKLPADQLKVPLDGYVSIIRIDPDQRTLRLSLARGKLRLHSSAAGPMVGIDLVPSSYSGDPPDVVDPTAPPPPDTGPVAVKLKIAVDADKTSLAFEWGEAVDYDAKIDKGKISVVFKRGGSIDVSRLQKNPPAFVKGASTSGGDDKVLLDITVDPDSPVTHRREKTRIVFDIGAPKNDKDSEPQVIVPDEIVAEAKPDAPKDKPADKAPDAKPAEAKPDEAKPGDDHPAEAPPADDPHAKKEGEDTGLRPGSDGAAIAAAEDQPEDKAIAAEETHADDQPAAGGDAAADDHADDKGGKPDDHPAGEPKAGEPKAGEPKAGEPKAGEPKAGEPKAGEPKAGEPKADEHAAAPPAKDDGHGGETDAKGHEDAAPPAEVEPPHDAPAFKVVRVKNEITLILPALNSSAAAMFKRGNTAFVMLDKAGPIDPAAILKSNKDVILSADVQQKGTTTILVLAFAKPYAVTAGVQSGAWIATISPDPLDPPRPVALLRDARTVGPAKVRATLDRAGPVVEIADPASGERLMAVLASGEPQGVIGARAYVEFAADPSAQGLLVRLFADDVTVTPTEHDVLIASQAGLTLSAGTVTDYAPERMAIGDGVHPAEMDFAGWMGKGSYLEGRSHLVNAIHPNGDNIAAARLDLARFYLAHDLGAEALGELQLLVADDESVVGDPSFRALRGVALLLLDRPKAALDDFGAANLDDDPNAQLFRGVAAAGMSDWSTARDAIVAGESMISGFRPDWQARFRVAGARAALETNAVDVADRMLGAMPKENVPRPFSIEADLIRGELAQRLKRTAEALHLFDEVEAANYRPLAVRATLAEIVLKEQTGDMKPADAIKALDDLRWQWRGDGLELSVLHRLASLQVAGGDYRNGLQTMRAAVLGFPEEDEARRIGTEMSAVFEDLFLHGKADALPPIQALGLYYDFKELTPIGTLGDDMVRRLADRLIAVDLLDQAAELLQHQVDRRLDGVAKAQIAAKLAAVYLMDRKPEKALAALRTSSQTRLPDDLAGQRRLLTGRALSDLKQYDAALDAFEQDETPEANRLRADVLWSASRWTETAAAVEILIAHREENPAALDAVDRYDIMRAAVAYTMAEDEKGLGSLRDRFVTMMANTPEAAAFDVVTRAVDPSGVAFRDTAKAIAGTDTLDTFLQSLGLGKPAPGSASK